MLIKEQNNSNQKLVVDRSHSFTTQCPIYVSSLFTWKIMFVLTFKNV